MGVARNAIPAISAAVLNRGVDGCH